MYDKSQLPGMFVVFGIIAVIGLIALYKAKTDPLPAIPPISQRQTPSLGYQGSSRQVPNYQTRTQSGNNFMMGSSQYNSNYSQANQRIRQLESDPSINRLRELNTEKFILWCLICHYQTQMTEGQSPPQVQCYDAFGSPRANHSWIKL